MADQKTMERIRKLFALSKSSNPAEAALALERAQKLMLEAGVTQDDLDFASIKESVSDFAFSKALKPPQWMISLGAIICVQFGVKARAGLGKIVFYGREERVSVASYVIAVLGRQLVRARADFLKSLSKRMKRANRISRADHFAEGWVQSVWKLISPMALSDHETAILKSYSDRTSGGPMETRAAKKVRGEDDAFVAGFREGSKARLHFGVSGQKAAALGVS